MTEENNSTENKAQVATEQKPSDKELNFRALEARYERQLMQERAAREAAEKQAQEALARKQTVEEDDDDSDDEPYVDHKKLKKKLHKFQEKSKQETQSEIQRAVQTALGEERKNNWIKQNPDFYDTLQHAEKLAMKDPELAETILQMPDGFERQKLVYKTIKSMNLHKPEEKASTIQEKIDNNRRGNYYQPTGMAGPGYSAQGDFSPAGQKNAYEKMKQLKARLGALP